MINYFYDCYQILNKVYSDKTYLKQAISSTFIEEKNRALTVKTCYGVLDKDIELSYNISYFCDKNPKLAIRTILKIAMYAIKYLNKHDYAVIKNAVELTKKLGKGGTSGFVNAFLRKFVGCEIVLPKDDIKNLSVKYSYPEFLVEELIKDYGKEKAQNIMGSSNAKTCLSFYDVDGEEYLNKLGKEFEKTPYHNVFLLNNFVRNEDYDKGIYTYQALGSVAICDGVKPCENLLDCCSAPGGKSIRLSYKCKNVYSWDIHQHRVDLVFDYKKRMNRENVFPKLKDAKVFDDGLIDMFDAVLVDAPCSGTGVINDNPDIKLNREKDSIKALNKEQLSILKTVSKYVKVGGYLYYSTCSILNCENKGIIDAFMSDINGFEIVETDSKIKAKLIDGTIQTLPDENGLGFYFATLKRVF